MVDVAFSGPRGWKMLDYIAALHDQDLIGSDSCEMMVRSLPFVFPCIYCRESLQRFVIPTELSDALEKNELRTYVYTLHDKVNMKLLKQENDRLIAYCRSNRFNPAEIRKFAIKELRTIPSPSLKGYLCQRPIRDDETFWDFVATVCLGFELNNKAEPRWYKKFIDSFMKIMFDTNVDTPVLQVDWLKLSWRYKKAAYFMYARNDEGLISKTPVEDLADKLRLTMPFTPTVPEDWDAFSTRIRTHIADCAISSGTCRKKEP